MKFQGQRTYAPEKERKMFVSAEKLRICEEAIMISFKILT
jgi:hypothetical protein